MRTLQPEIERAVALVNLDDRSAAVDDRGARGVRRARRGPHRGRRAGRRGVCSTSCGPCSRQPIATSPQRRSTRCSADTPARRASSATSRGTGTCTSTAPTTRRGRVVGGVGRLALATRLVAVGRRAVGRVRADGCTQRVRPRRPRRRAPLVLDDVRQPRAGPAPPASPQDRPDRAGSGGQDEVDQRGERARPAEHAAVPARRGEGDGPRLVLEHPAGEVAPAPRRRRGRATAIGAAGAAGVGQHPAEAGRHAVVGDEVVADRRLVAPATAAASSAPPARIASAARRPVSSAWPMPSPVITSVAIAASPVSSTRPDVSGAASMRAGIGHAVWRPSPAARGPSAARMCGRSSRPAHMRLHVLDAPGAVAQHAEADVGPAARQRERPRVAGQEVVVEPHEQVARRRRRRRRGRTGGRRATRRGSRARPGRRALRTGLHMPSAATT